MSPTDGSNSNFPPQLEFQAETMGPWRPSTLEESAGTLAGFIFALRGNTCMLVRAGEGPEARS
jgi:hypothetical protein